MEEDLLVSYVLQHFEMRGDLGLVKGRNLCTCNSEREAIDTLHRYIDQWMTIHEEMEEMPEEAVGDLFPDKVMSHYLRDTEDGGIHLFVCSKSCISISKFLELYTDVERDLDADHREPPIVMGKIMGKEEEEE